MIILYWWVANMIWTLWSGEQWSSNKRERSTKWGDSGQVVVLRSNQVQYLHPFRMDWWISGNSNYVKMSRWIQNGVMDTCMMPGWGDGWMVVHLSHFSASPQLSSLSRGECDAIMDQKGQDGDFLVSCPANKSRFNQLYKTKGARFRVNDRGFFGFFEGSWEKQTLPGSCGRRY